MNRRPRAAARRVLPILREWFDPLERATADRVTCRRGCAHCCYKFVDGGLAEGALIALHVRETMPERERAIRAGLAAQIKTLEALGSREHEARYFDAHHACVFLDQATQDCSIYSVRPASCRQHLAVSDPALCSPALNPEGVVSFIDARAVSHAFYKQLCQETLSEIPFVAGPLQSVVLIGFELLDRAPRDFERWLRTSPLVYVNPQGQLGRGATP